MAPRIAKRGLIEFFVCFTPQLVMSGAELGSSVDEVESLLKRHENLEKLVLVQEEKIGALLELAENLGSHEHFATEAMKERMAAICERQKKLRKLLEQRRKDLEDSQKLAQFYQDIVEVRFMCFYAVVNVLEIILFHSNSQ